MAIFAAPAVPRTVVKTSFSSTSTISKLPHLTSLQFPTELRTFQLRSQSLKSMPSRRTLLFFYPQLKWWCLVFAEVASKQQTFSSFDELLEKSDKPVLVDFYATWCGPCQFMVPVLEQVSSKMEGKILVVKIDTEKYSSLANEYSIKAFPTFILFVNGKPVDRFEGAMTADKLIERIETSLKVKQSGRGEII
ncbi:uncharacterized protein [Primulina eburnea]|uniref:uncharacterized protein isoform X2 n=1 Tax=Primulina eburnea TaxID=1245227 RepID=UPI003C6C2032